LQLSNYSCITLWLLYYFMTIIWQSHAWRRHMARR
jgi:hypothetical protein